jgi:hypothetical protein
MPSAHWNIDAAILAWVRAESKRLGRSTSQVVSSILMAAKAQEELIAAPSVAAWLESAQYDDTTEEEQRTLGEAASLLRRRWSER